MNVKGVAKNILDFFMGKLLVLIVVVQEDAGTVRELGIFGYRK